MLTSFGGIGIETPEIKAVLVLEATDLVLLVGVLGRGVCCGGVDEMIAAAPADQLVALLPAGDLVIALAAFDPITSEIAREAVIACLAVD